MGSGLIKEVGAVKDKKGIYELAVSIECIVAAVLMFYRCFFGTALVDEAYYVSDALAMLHGNLPYCYNWFSGCGMDFLLIPPLFIYECFRPDLEGVFLFTRLCFVVFRMGILLFAFKLIKKRLPKVHALMLISVLVPFYGAVIQNFSYNTIPVWMGFLTGIILWDAGSNRKYKDIKYLMAGFCSALAVFAHPIYAVNILLFIFLIIIYDRKILSLLWYLLGGIIEILIVLIPLVAQCGIQKLLYGFAYIVNSHMDKGSSLVRSTPISRVADCFHAFYWFWLVELITFVLVYLGVKKICAKRKKREEGSIYILAVICGVGAGIAAVAVLNDFDLNAYCSLGGVCFLGFILVLGKAKKRRELVYAGVPPILFVWFEVLLTGSNGVQIRFYSCVICSFAVLWAFFLDDDKVVHRAAAVLGLIIVVLQCYIDFNYIYRDAPLRNLNNRVESGVYKGIYTSVDRAHDLPELEQYLELAVEDQEAVAFRDNAPCAYLMKNQNICDVWTWDTLQYERGNKSPYKMYAYYKAKNTIPDKIIYVDFGRTELLSVEDEDFPYNEFVGRHYTLMEDRQLNSTFRIKLYVNNGTFDENYDYWINKSR